MSLTRSSTMDSSFARVRLMFRCFGPVESAVMYGRIDLGLLPRGELDLCLLGRLLEPLHGQRILADIDPALLLELRRQVVDDALVEVLAAKEGIAVGRQNLELMFAVDFGDLDDRNVEGAAAQVVNRDLAIAAAFIQPVRQRSRRRLVDDAPDFETGDAARHPWSPAAGNR